jgi:hypothetical protein
MATQNNLSKEQFLNAMQTVRGLSEKELRAKIEDSIKGQKLYSAIAFSKMSQPTTEEENEYYQLHLDDFSRPESFEVTTYVSPSQEALAAKIADPMRHINPSEVKMRASPTVKLTLNWLKSSIKSQTGASDLFYPTVKMVL